MQVQAFFDPSLNIIEGQDAAFRNPQVQPVLRRIGPKFQARRRVEFAGFQYRAAAAYLVYFAQLIFDGFVPALDELRLGGDPRGRAGAGVMVNERTGWGTIPRPRG